MLLLSGQHPLFLSKYFGLFICLGRIWPHWWHQILIKCDSCLDCFCHPLCYLWPTSWIISLPANFTPFSTIMLCRIRQVPTVFEIDIVFRSWMGFCWIFHCIYRILNACLMFLHDPSCHTIHCFLNGIIGLDTDFTKGYQDGKIPSSPQKTYGISLCNLGKECKLTLIHFLPRCHLTTNKMAHI